MSASSPTSAGSALGHSGDGQTVVGSAARASAPVSTTTTARLLRETARIDHRAEKSSFAVVLTSRAGEQVPVREFDQIGEAQSFVEKLAEATGLRTGRRMSHVFVIDVPTYPRLLLLTDAAMNIAPTLEDKRDIVQNAIDLAHVLGIETPRVALLSAVETVNPRIRSSIEAAAICKMADRGQICGGVVDGPLAFDNAVSRESASIKGIHSSVAGDADILVVPDIESGNMLYKKLRYFSGAQGAGIVLGAKVPIILTSRSGDAENRVVSCALALLYARSIS